MHRRGIRHFLRVGPEPDGFPACDLGERAEHASPKALAEVHEDSDGVGRLHREERVLRLLEEDLVAGVLVTADQPDTELPDDGREDAEEERRPDRMRPPLVRPHDRRDEGRSVGKTRLRARSQIAGEGVEGRVRSEVGVMYSLGCEVALEEREALRHGAEKLGEFHEASGGCGWVLVLVARR